MEPDEHAEGDGGGAVADVLTPDQLNEKFVIWLNAEGSPVRRTLREMTAGEVLAAFSWSRAECERLESEIEPAQALAIAAEEGHLDMLAGKTRDELRAAGTLLRTAGEAMQRHARLLSLIQVAMPQWQRHDDKGLRDAVRRYWRAA